MNEIVVSGMRPTGALHIGHYVSVIKNWVELQKVHDCHFFLADWHALTSNYDTIDVIRNARREYVRGWIACGIDPQKSVIYCQSKIPEILYLNQFFLCLTPPGWADRSPSWKDHVQNPVNKKLDNLGFYTYPALMAVDIAIAKAQLVPVGEDQITHVEIAREIVRKFNRTYGTKLPEPMPKLTATPKIPSIDGSEKKMSSSLGNVITLRETENSLKKHIAKMKTDDKRNGVENPGNPDNCVVYFFHKIFSPAETTQNVCTSCKSAKLSCGECKQILLKSMKDELLPIGEKMAAITDKQCDEIIAAGTEVMSKKIKTFWDEISTKIGFY